MYCTNCGKKIEDNADFCLGCGRILSKKTTEVVTTLGETVNEKTGNGKAIASLVLGIIGVFYALQAFLSIDFAVSEIYFYDLVSEKIGYMIGFILVQSIFAIVAVCLAVSSQKKERNGFNVAGFWLSIATFMLAFIQIIILGSNW